MSASTDRTFDGLVEEYLGKRPPDGMTSTFAMSTLSSEAQNFILRMLTLMRQSGYATTEFNPHLIHWLSATVPSTLPGAWGGQIPPLTLPGRHRKLDDYVAGLHPPPVGKPHLLVDVGCGFPPVTPADTAARLPDWQVYGVDRSFADYVLYDADGHYACFDQDGSFQYFQALMNASGRALYADPAAARNKFNTLFAELFPLLPDPDGKRSQTVEKDNNRLIRDHIRDFETDNLTLIKNDFMALSLPPVKVIRCMNVFVYYEPADRKKMLARAEALLDHDGILIAGTNGLGIQTRYTVYRKGGEGLGMDEFAFGLDNVGHIVFMPFFSIHANDPEALLLAELAGTIRNSRPFGSEFGRRQDELLKLHGLCRRGSDGFLHFGDDGMQVGEYIQRMNRLWQQMEAEGYLDGAVDVLKQAGYDACKNPVGDLAIRPPAESIDR